MPRPRSTFALHVGKFALSCDMASKRATRVRGASTSRFPRVSSRTSHGSVLQGGFRDVCWPVGPHLCDHRLHVAPDYGALVCHGLVGHSSTLGLVVSLAALLHAHARAKHNQVLHKLEDIAALITSAAGGDRERVDNEIDLLRGVAVRFRHGSCVCVLWRAIQKTCGGYCLSVCDRFR